MKNLPFFVPSGHFLPVLKFLTSQKFQLLLMFLILQTVGGCGRNPETVSVTDAQKEQSSQNSYCVQNSQELMNAVPQRVVSLSPALTEMMFELGLEEHLVGVTDHCKYPPAAQNKTHVGTIFTPNLELLAALKPDCILMNCRTPERAQSFIRFGWTPMTLPDERLEDVFSNIRRLGQLFHVPDRAETLATKLESRLATLRASTSVRSSVRVLLVLSRNYVSPRLEDVYLAGHDELCTPLLAASGGQNAYVGNAPYPKVSPEGILAMNPEVILEIVPDQVFSEALPEQLDRAWQTLPMLTAVREKRIFRIRESEAALIPGPSMILWAEKIATILATSPSQRSGQSSAER